MAFLRALALCLSVWGAGVSAQGTSAKFTVEGEVLVYHTERAGDLSEGIESGDVDVLRALLRENPQLRVVQLTSGGGSLWAAQEISDILIARGLDTHVVGECDSSCVIVFLAGKRRSMARGARLGFHQVSWSAQNIEEFFARDAEEFGWATPWEFAEWIYADTQEEVYRHLAYMVARGVDPGFAIQSIRRPNGDMWRPHQAILRAAGVLTN